MRASKAAQSRQVPVMKVSRMESGRQFASVELRIVPRTWDSAHIDQPLYLMCFQDMDELLGRARGMPNGHDDQRWR